MSSPAVRRLLLDKYGPFTNKVALTLSGNEITDLTRAAGLQGDGLPLGSGMGIWAAATNRCINGNATSNTTGITDNSSTTSRVTAGVAKFGTTAFEVVSGNAAANEGPSQAISGGAAATQYTISAWAWLISGAATVRATLSDSVSGKQGGTAVALTAVPQKVTVTATTGAASASIISLIETTVQAAGTWRIGGWQVETGAISTPYIETDGETDGGTAARVQCPVAGLFTATQGGVFIRRRHGWATLSGARTEWAWGNDTPNRVLGYWASSSALNLLRSSGTDASDVAATHSVATIASLSWGWDSAQVTVDYNATGRATAANATIPTITATLMDIGSQTWQVGNRQIMGDILWFATFSLPLSNADNALLNSMGNAPNYNRLARIANCTGVIDFREAIPVLRKRVGV